MYNRYVPQPDGSYRKNRVENQPPNPIPCPEPTPPPVSPCPPPPKMPPLPPSKQNTGATDFLRQLLPKNLDTGDLLVILLLLLIAGDCREDRNSALLTLALYLFL